MDLVSQFEPWIAPRTNIPAPVVIVGAGLSYGLVPTAQQLANEVADNKGAIEHSLGVSCSIVPTKPQELYQWAASCLVQLEAKGMSKTAAKRLLADTIGVTFDARFLAKTNIPSRGTTTRHRVLGRLAREGRIHAIWSFNWDCWLEAALESVGLRRGPRFLATMVAPVNWKLQYQVWVDGLRVSPTIDLLPLFKAHGCARALHGGDGDFVISYDEMCVHLPDQPRGRVDRLTNDLTERWTVTVGWSATEQYVQQLLSEMKANSLLSNRLTVIDINPHQEELSRVCDHYSTTSSIAGVKVFPGEQGTTDDLFFWIQIKRGLAALQWACSGLRDYVSSLETLGANVPPFDSAKMIAFWQGSFLDSWLPIWLRTCFLIGAQDLGTNDEYRVDVLPTEQRDAHIPWCGDQIDRKDLKSAAMLLLRLASITGTSRPWDFETFPGGLWDRRRQLLVLPVPYWTPLSKISAISLKPLLESAHWYDKARIRSLAILPLFQPSEETPTVTPNDPRIERWKEVMASSFNHRFLADPDNIQVVDFIELSSPENWSAKWP